ncbi:hypothetical protein QWZ13_00735 [Reinekea marina]|uniref:hypothetical protein n=1 Tax=Reinekea marina TaxID=1310421 RepID=UPI0025B5E075|nr:hypothetical protein [Reinekea marina]MDN3647429.1 hypothetical protein [Reinekea marina]
MSRGALAAYNLPIHNDVDWRKNEVYRNVGSRIGNNSGILWRLLMGFSHHKPT